MKASISILTFTLILNCFAWAKENDQERYKSVLNQAIFEQKNGQHKTAIKLFKKVYNKSAALKSQAFAGLVASYKSSNKIDAAVEILRAEIRNNPFTSDLRITLANTLFEDSKYQEALNEIVFIEKLIARDPRVQKIKYSAQQHLGRHSEAIETLTQYLTLKPKDTNALLDRAEFYFQLKQHKNAFLDARKAYELKLFDEQTMSVYLKMSYYNERYREVTRVGNKCTKLFPGNFSCHEYVGRVALYRKQYRQAVKEFTAATTLQPANSEVKLLLAESLTFTGQTLEAHTHFSQLLKDDPSYEPAARSWAKFLLKQGKVEELGNMIKEFHTHSPKSIWATVELSNLLLLVGNNEDALDQMKYLSKESKSDVTSFYYAYFLSRVDENEKSVSALNEVKDASYNVEFHKGLLYHKQNKFSEAVQAWLQVPTDSSVRVKAQINAALTFEKMGEVEKSKEILSSLTLQNERKPAQELTYFLEWILPPL